MTHDDELRPNAIGHLIEVHPSKINMTIASENIKFQNNFIHNRIKYLNTISQHGGQYNMHVKIITELQIRSTVKSKVR